MSRSRLRRGSSVVDALVGAALAGIALAGLAAVGALATQSLRLARDTASALALATDRLEALRGGPRTAGDDRWVAPDGTVFDRTWSHDGGRGRPVGLSARVAWGRRAVDLRTEAWR
jgi:hypothetical protein